MRRADLAFLGRLLKRRLEQVLDCKKCKSFDIMMGGRGRVLLIQETCKKHDANSLLSPVARQIARAQRIQEDGLIWRSQRGKNT